MFSANQRRNGYQANESNKYADFAKPATRKNRRLIMSAYTMETLEIRRMLSGSIAESEPNNTLASANSLPRQLGAPLHVTGKVASAGDVDWFKVDLKKGDVIGAALQGKDGLDPAIRLVNSSGVLMVGNDDDGARSAGSIYQAPESPLPANDPADSNCEFTYVISRAGTYYIEVSASAAASLGKYALDLVVARPGMEAQPVGAKQILFLDFDGATVDFRDWSIDDLKPFGKTKVAPLADSLAAWGLTKADENAVIDQVIARITDKLSTYVRAHGRNGDYAASGKPGEFDIEIRNSRDDRDRFGKNPLVSRVAIGALNDPELLTHLIGASQYDDVGNFSTNDDAIVSLDWMTDAVAYQQLESTAAISGLVGEMIAWLGAHEAGHNFGCNHTDYNWNDLFDGLPNIMDPDGRVTLGQDFIWGTADDVSLQFGSDGYLRDEPFQGLNDTLNTIAFGLSTGKQASGGGSLQGLSAAAPVFVTTQISSASLFGSLKGVSHSGVLD
jgi:hypothetical protein